MAQRTDLTLPNTDCTCTVYRWPFERARSEKKAQSGGDHQQCRASPMDTKPWHSIPVGQRAEMVTCLCFVNTLAMRCGTIAQQRCTGRSAIIRWPIFISKPQIFPFRVRIGEEHLQHILTLQVFISHLAIFSHKTHNLLTRYELNYFCINVTIAHLLCYFFEHFWSRIEVLHVCHLVVGNTHAILHHIRNYSLFHEV